MEVTIEITEQGQQTLTEMQTFISTLQGWYGQDSEAYRHAFFSYANCLSTMMRLGGRVMADGDKSLIVNRDGFVYGVNYSPDRTRPVEYKDIESAPIPGTWSVNS